MRFSSKTPGTKAKQRTGKSTCIWCDAAALNDNKAWQKPNFIKNLLCSLAAFDATAEAIFEAALERVEDGERRNRLRAGVTSDKCTGLDPETPCVFAQQIPGRKATRRTAKTTCIWCDPLALNDDAAWEKPQFIGRLVRSLVTFYTKATAIFHTALGRVTAEEHRSQLYASLASSKLLDGGTRLRLQLEQCKIREQWSLELACRCRALKPPSRKEKEQFREWNREDQRRIRKKMPAVVAAWQAKDESWRSTRAAAFQHWCNFSSWAMCGTCARLKAQPFLQRDLTNPGGRCATISDKQCPACTGVGYRAPQPEDIPDELARLSEKQLLALRPLTIDTGRYSRNESGYREHTAMIRFRWRKHSILEAIKMLRRSKRAATRQAYYFLMNKEDSSYARFVRLHKAILRRGGDEGPSDQALKLPVRFMEEVGLECALWPHLYYRTTMCESYVRSQDVRRVLRKKPKLTIEKDSDESSEEEPPADPNVTRRQSLKRSFLDKVLSPVMGYGASYELLHYVYDLWLSSLLGGRKNVHKAPMRIMMATESFSPEYWRAHHACLIDMVRQVGWPTLFVTIAPWEWSFPYHVWLMDEMQTMLRSRLHLPAAETLHIAHALTQCVKGLLAGSTHSRSGGNENEVFHEHVFQDPETKERCRICFFGRIEFQDGKRKRYVRGRRPVSHTYHGRGTPPLHVLF